MTHNHFQFANSQCQLFMICIDLTFLTTRLPFWEGFTCLDVSQCLPNKGILQCAVKYLELDISVVHNFLPLGPRYICSFHTLCTSRNIFLQNHVVPRFSIEG
jgi:hypothetical protein